MNRNQRDTDPGVDFTARSRKACNLRQCGHEVGKDLGLTKDPGKLSATGGHWNRTEAGQDSKNGLMVLPYFLFIYFFTCLVSLLYPCCDSRIPFLG